MLDAYVPSVKVSVTQPNDLDDNPSDEWVSPVVCKRALPRLPLSPLACSFISILILSRSICCVVPYVCPPSPPSGRWFVYGTPPRCVDSDGEMPHRHPDLPSGQGRGAAGRVGQGRAQRLSVLAPSQRTPPVRVEPHLDDLAAAGPPAVRHPVLLPVLRHHHHEPDCVPTPVEPLDRSGLQQLEPKSVEQHPTPTATESLRCFLIFFVSSPPWSIGMDGQRCRLFCRLRRGRGGPWVGFGCEVVGEGAEEVHDLAGWLLIGCLLSVWSMNIHRFMFVGVGVVDA